MPDKSESFFGVRYQPVRLVIYGVIAILIAFFVGIKGFGPTTSVTWAIMGNGVFLMALLVLYFFQNFQHSVKIERLADSLAKSNEALREEMTQRQSLEEQLRQSQKMEAVGRLAGGLAHDFNNILTVITGCSEMELRNLAPDNPIRENLEEIHSAGEQAAFLVQQLLTFSRRRIFRPITIDLNELILSMDRMFRRLVPATIEFVTMPADKPCKVNVDPNYFQHVLANLVVNACDAMLDGGKLLIQTQNVHLSARDVRNRADRFPGDQILLTVSDTGVGMTKDVMAKIFEPFFTTKEKGRGTGLGLATCYGIVQQSQGCIEAESEPGKGATFRISLPKAEGPLSKLAREDDSQTPPRGMETVLLVEDEGLVRSFASRVLRHQGYRVIEMSNGEEALSFMEKNPDAGIHLLLTDIVMPKMDGKQLADKLASVYPKLKILFTSGYAEHILGAQGSSGDGVAFLAKPFSPSDLARKVREVLDK
ncbi:MAG: ATP-binding protein [Candidatus Omnitrophota bacterium]